MAGRWRQITETFWLRILVVDFSWGMGDTTTRRFIPINRPAADEPDLLRAHVNKTSFSRVGASGGT